MSLTQTPDIGKAIFDHTSDSHMIELPFLGELQLPTGWRLFGIDVSPTKHVIFLGLAALLVFLTIWLAGRSVQRRHAALIRGIGVSARAQQVLQSGRLCARVPSIRAGLAVAGVVQGLGTTTVSRADVGAACDKRSGDVRPIRGRGDVQRRITRVDVVPDLAQIGRG